MEIKNDNPLLLSEEELHKITLLFALTPSYFYSPQGRSILDQEEIDERKIYGSFMSRIGIARKEIVFRKFWEVSEYLSDEQYIQAPQSWTFLLEQGLSNEEILTLLNELCQEAIALFQGKGRVLHNPF